MKILFYLPAVTPWWFDAIVAPMLRTLHYSRTPVELHVMVAPLWRNTGIGAEQYIGLADLTRLHWHIVDVGQPADFRFAGNAVPGLTECIAAIDPDLTLARSADFVTPADFPGTVRFLMEGAAPPFATDPRWIVLDERPFVHGAMPAAAADLGEAGARRLQPAWDRIERAAARRTRAGLGLPEDRPVLVVPLQYEHEENLFLTHAAFPRGAALIGHLLANLPPDVLLAVTDHPLNRLHAGDPASPLHVARREVEGLIAAHPDRALLHPADGATDMLVPLADAVLADLSKTWAIAAFHGTPLVRLGERPLAHWLHALPGLEPLSRWSGRPALSGPDRMAARRWFGWHFGARLLDPALLTPERLQRAVTGQPSEGDVLANWAMIDERLEEAA